ncbi:MAG TPA: phenylphosphate carboxylase subunit delta, partial [Dehalococcoidia bacterium]|nr:phenylphosphate carboxylase subunit delta [Dehalococcoidia bacterium]
GDDLIDLPAMNQAGLAIAVANAQPLVLQRADWVTEKAGGQGAVREVCEMILKAQGLLETAYQRYLPD